MVKELSWIPAACLLFCAGAIGTASAADAAAPTAPDRDLALGGSVALDDESRLDAKEDPRMGLSEVALGAEVALAEGIRAAVLLKAEDDLDALFFDQAVASLAPNGSPWAFYIGQQTFNHGYLTTRLISDPMLLPWVEVKQPGAIATYTAGALTAGAGLVLAETAVPGAGTDSATSRDYAFLPNLDWVRGPLQARLSGMFSRYRNDADLAASLTAWRFTFDAEGFSRLSMWDAHDRTSGFSLGAQCDLGHGLAAALRQDGLSPKAGAALSAWRFGAGATYSIRRDLFAAAEYAFGHGTEDAGHRLALRIGLRSTLHLPGFQRETLSQP